MKGNRVMTCHATSTSKCHAMLVELSCQNPQVMSHQPGNDQSSMFDGRVDNIGEVLGSTKRNFRWLIVGLIESM
jgi:hypothetical protein